MQASVWLKTERRLPVPRRRRADGDDDAAGLAGCAQVERHDAVRVGHGHDGVEALDGHLLVLVEEGEHPAPGRGRPGLVQPFDAGGKALFGVYDAVVD